MSMDHFIKNMFGADTPDDRRRWDEDRARRQQGVTGVRGAIAGGITGYMDFKMMDLQARLIAERTAQAQDRHEQSRVVRRSDGVTPARYESTDYLPHPQENDGPDFF